MILMFGSQKGGVGKSTIATNVAVEFSRQGLDTLIVDTDPQKTSANWANRRGALDNETSIISVEKTGNIRESVLDLDNRYDIVVIDAGGNDNQALRTGMTAADIFYTPFRPSQADLETLDFMKELIITAKDFNPEMMSYIALAILLI